MEVVAAPNATSTPATQLSLWTRSNIQTLDDITGGREPKKIDDFFPLLSKANFVSNES